MQRGSEQENIVDSALKAFIPIALDVSLRRENHIYIATDYYESQGKRDY